jgi:hypothetical protein
MKLRFSADILTICIFENASRIFEIVSNVMQVGTLALVDIATLSCFNHNYLRIFTQAPCLFTNLYKIFFNKNIYIRLVAITI